MYSQCGREFCVAAAGPVIAQQGRLRMLGEPFAFGLVERVLSVTIPNQVHVVLNSVNGHVDECVDVDVLMAWSA